MKKIVFLLGFGLVLGLGNVNAQCKKSGAACCKSKGTAAVGMTPTNATSIADMPVSEAALTAATSDASIEKKVCELSGKVSFQRKAVDATTGAVSYTDVVYDEAKAMFVNQVATEASTSTEKKSCGAGASSGKSCCKKGQKSCAKGEAAAPASQENVAPTKMQ